MSDTPRTDALIERHKAEAADADRECLRELSVAQIKELIAHTRQLERDAERLDALEKMRATVYASFDPESARLMHWVVVDEFQAKTHAARKGCVAKSLRAAIDAALAAASGTPQDNAVSK
jgi:hypothetical protein